MMATLEERWAAARRGLVAARAASDQRRDQAPASPSGGLADITITCDLDGAVRSVRFAPGHRQRLTGAGVAAALRLALRTVRYEAVPTGPDAAAGPGSRATGTATPAAGPDVADRRAARLAADRALLAEIERRRDLGRADREGELVGSSAHQNVTVRYRRGLLADISPRRAWVWAAGEKAIEQAVVEASRAALAPAAGPVIGGWAWSR